MVNAVAYKAVFYTFLRIMLTTSRSFGCIGGFKVGFISQFIPRAIGGSLLAKRSKKDHPLETSPEMLRPEP